MKAAGIEVIRIAEFAWTIFEPRENEFTFEFFDSFMALALEEGMKVIFCTPTATPPAWMSHRYPEILNADKDGHLIGHGHRRHPNFSSERFREFSARITEKLGEHYGGHPCVIAWQLDNEINCECATYLSESDHEAFRAWLQKRFGTLDAFNNAIGARFWSQTYTDWEEVFLPRRTVHEGRGNPHLELLQKRFVSDTVIRYFRMQAEILRRYTSAPITTNGLFQNLDYRELTDEHLDFISFDNYPNFGANGRWHAKDGLRDREVSYNLMRTRSISPNFAVMEQQSGPGGWTFNLGPQATAKPGQIRLWTLQTIAHGADYVGYFRWRTCAFGTEIYWHGILNYDNRDNRRLSEIAETSRDVKRLQEACGKSYVAEVALLSDYENEWDAEIDDWHRCISQDSIHNWFQTCQYEHVPLDMVYINDKTPLSELLPYKMVVYPHPIILSEARAALLKQYAEAGGTVLLGCRSGYKDLDGKCPMMPTPGPAAEMCGVTVEDFTFRAVVEEKQTVRLFGKSISADVFNDILHPEDCRVVGTYEKDFYKGSPAVTVKELGKGKVYYFGGAFAEDTVKAFLEAEGIGMPCGLEGVLTLPREMELAVRGDLVFLLNYMDYEIEVPCAAACTDQLSGETFADGKITMKPYGVAVLRLQELTGKKA
jgi:beta-galactosidase